MTSIELNPKTMIYSPPLLLFGGANINYGHAEDTIIKDLEKLLRDISDSMYQAYDIKTYLKTKELIIEGILKPINNEVDLKCVDYNTRSKPLLKGLLKKLENNNAVQGIFLGEYDHPIWQFYFIQLLTDEFSPENSSNLLVAIQNAALVLSYRKGMVNGLITGDSIKLHTELRDNEYNLFL